MAAPLPRVGGFLPAGVWGGWHVCASVYDGAELCLVDLVYWCCGWILGFDIFGFMVGFDELCFVPWVWVAC